MAKEYNWTVSSIKVDDSRTVEGQSYENVVVSINWRYSVAENGETVEVHGTQNFIDFDEEGFVEFDSLTEADIKRWFESANNMEEINANMDKMLGQKVNGQSFKAAPWI
jgi:hypothetical protein